MPPLLQLTENFRTHNGVLFLARTVVDLISHLFPNSIDKMEPESSQVHSPAPIFLLHPKGRSDRSLSLLEQLFGPATRVEKAPQAKHKKHSKQQQQQEEEQVQEQGQSRARFGADQVVLVRDAASKAAVQRLTGTGGALVFTVLEAKGMEFEDCLIVDFFSSGALGQRVAASVRAAGRLRRAQGGLLNPLRHAGLEQELKMLYVLITRTKRNLVFIDDGSTRSGGSHPFSSSSNNGVGAEKGSSDFMTSKSATAASQPMLQLWTERALVRPREFGADIVELFQDHSSAEEWDARGMACFAKLQFDSAKMCFEKAKNELMHSVADAKALIQRADCDQGQAAANSAAATAATASIAATITTGDMQTVLLRRAKLICAKLRDRHDFRSAPQHIQRDVLHDLASCHEKLSEFSQAGLLFREISKLHHAVVCFVKAGAFAEAAAVCWELNQVEEALAYSYKAHSYAEAIKQLCTAKDTRVLSEQEHAAKRSECARKAALFYHSMDNTDQMMLFVGMLRTADEQRLLLERYGRFRQLAELEEAWGELARAGEAYCRLREYAEAAELFQRAGMQVRATEARLRDVCQQHLTARFAPVLPAAEKAKLREVMFEVERAGAGAGAPANQPAGKRLSSSLSLKASNIKQSKSSGDGCGSSSFTSLLLKLRLCCAEDLPALARLFRQIAGLAQPATPPPSISESRTGPLIAFRSSPALSPSQCTFSQQLLLSVMLVYELGIVAITDRNTSSATKGSNVSQGKTGVAKATKKSKKKQQGGNRNSQQGCNLTSQDTGDALNPCEVLALLTDAHRVLCHLLVPLRDAIRAVEVEGGVPVPKHHRAIIASCAEFFDATLPFGHPGSALCRKSILSLPRYPAFVSQLLGISSVESSTVSLGIFLRKALGVLTGACVEISRVCDTALQVDQQSLEQTAVQCKSGYLAWLNQPAVARRSQLQWNTLRRADVLVQRIGLAERQYSTLLLAQHSTILTADGTAGGTIEDHRCSLNHVKDLVHGLRKNLGNILLASKFLWEEPHELQVVRCSQECVNAAATTAATATVLSMKSGTGSSGNITTSASIGRISQIAGELLVAHACGDTSHCISRQQQLLLGSRTMRAGDADGRGVLLDAFAWEWSSGVTHTQQASDTEQRNWFMYSVQLGVNGIRQNLLQTQASKMDYLHPLILLTLLEKYTVLALLEYHTFRGVLLPERLTRSVLCRRCAAYHAEIAVMRTLHKSSPVAKHRRTEARGTVRSLSNLLEKVLVWTVREPTLIEQWMSTHSVKAADRAYFLRSLVLLMASLANNDNRVARERTLATVRLAYEPLIVGQPELFEKFLAKCKAAQTSSEGAGYLKTLLKECHHYLDDPLIIISVRRDFEVPPYMEKLQVQHLCLSAADAKPAVSPVPHILLLTDFPPVAQTAHEVVARAGAGARAVVTNRAAGHNSRKQDIQAAGKEGRGKEEEEDDDDNAVEVVSVAAKLPTMHPTQRIKASMHQWLCRARSSLQQLTPLERLRRQAAAEVRELWAIEAAAHTPTPTPAAVCADPLAASPSAAVRFYCEAVCPMVLWLSGVLEEKQRMIAELSEALQKVTHI